MSHGETGCVECEKCFYCGCFLSTRHEHDHFPFPARDDGENTVPACINCHDLKDRKLLEDWPIDLFFEGYKELQTTGARLLVAKLIFVILDKEKRNTASNTVHTASDVVEQVTR